ncbi:vitamin K epoxide reductase family protein [Microbacterium sp. G2-8]|uniref:vitamin K epoxide reductase family protein n=1 Tax=Microbacterium sp. G2-8 TaxID=2842454 RepID=UPI001C8A4062|nr:vitamin K epoxide reductase family protein [Microbacterium sp. G2-8]
MEQTQKRPAALAVWLVIAGVVGLWAAFSLTMEKFEALIDPDHVAGCDFNPIVQCGANLDSAQGSAFGFPNPLLGLVGWMAPVVVGMALLAGARFAKWFWILFTAGMAFAFGFVVWLIIQSIYVIGTLCPWCMVTWVVTIPTFYAVLLHALRIGAFPVSRGVRKTADALMGWLPLLATLSFLAIIVLAELRLHLLDFFF